MELFAWCTVLKFALILLDDVGGTDKKIATAKSKNVHCVSEDFLDEVEKGGALLMITKKSIASWGGDVSSRWVPGSAERDIDT